MRNLTYRHLTMPGLVCVLFAVLVVLGEVPSVAARAEGVEKLFEMPEGAECEPGEVIVRVRPGADVAEVEDLLEDSPLVSVQGDATEEISAGVLKVELQPGAGVEDAVNDLLGEASPAMESVQPNYVYYLADEVDEGAPSPGEALSVEEEPLTVEEPIEEDAAGDAIAKDDVLPFEDATESVEDASPAPVVEEVSVVGPQSDGPSVEEGPVMSAQEDAGAAPTTIDDSYVDELWGLESMRTFDAWNLARCEGQVSVAVIDESFDVNHEDLAPNIVAGSAYNAYADRMGIADRIHDVSSLNGARNHGTHVAGIISAVANNELGVAGASYNAGIVPVKVFDDSVKPQTTSADVIKAYDYIMSVAEEYHIRVVNLSVGTAVPKDFEDDGLLAKIEEALEEGIVTVAAACNANASASGVPFYAYPGDSAFVVSVINLRHATASTTGNDASGKFNVARDSTSNYNVAGQGGTNKNDGKNISAPGTGILSTAYDNQYMTDTGTSMATPYVAGVLALEFAANPELTAGEAVNVLYASAHDLGDEGWDEQYGYGEVDALEAVEFAKGVTETTIDGVGTVGIRLMLPTGGYEFDWMPKEPDVEVVLEVKGATRALVRNIDYSVAYDHNVDAGTATVTVSGMGDFAGKFVKDLHFAIVARRLSEVRIALAAEEFAYTGLQIRPGVVGVLDGDVHLIEGVDFLNEITYANNYRVGTATATITGVGNYQGTATAEFRIVRAEVAVPKAKAPAYTGKAQVGVAEGEGYELSGTFKATKAGSYTAYATLDANHCWPGGSTARKMVTWKIARAEVAVPKAKAPTYTGKAQVGVVAGAGYALTGTMKATAAGSYVAYATPDANHCWPGGSTARKKLSWRIARASIAKAKIAAISVQPYTGKAIKPKPKVTLGSRSLKAGSDYAFSYASNVKAGTATVTVKGTGCYAGTKKATFRIVAPTVRYLSHCQTYGWGTSWVSDGKVSGTTGKSRRLEAVRIKLGTGFPVSGGIEYLSHLEKLGWASSWTSDGKVSGTTGQARRMEAIRIRLTGNMAKKYDVWYRAHVQRIGWMGWKKNGQVAGTTGRALRLEALQIVLVPKGMPAP